MSTPARRTSVPTLPSSDSIMQSTQAVVVKRTFIEILQNDPTTLEGDFLPLRSRIHSDPAMYCTTLSCATALHPEVETDIESSRAGDSSDSSDTDSLGQRASPQTGNTTDGGLCSRSLSSAASSSTLHSEDCHELEGLMQHHDANKKRDLDGLMASLLAQHDEEEDWRDLAGLLRENGRLALENKLLRDQARLAAENATLKGQNEAPQGMNMMQVQQMQYYEDPSNCQQMQQVCLPPGTWLVPFQCASYDGSMPQGFQMQGNFNFWGEPATQGGQTQMSESGKQQEETTASAPEKPPTPVAAGSKQKAASKDNSNNSNSNSTTNNSNNTNKEQKVAKVGNDVPPKEGDTRTTVMLRNVPSTYTRDMILSLIDEKGFAGKYDFIYLPIDFRTQACLGYAFVNFASPEDVPEFWKTFGGFAGWSVPSKKVCKVTWSDPHQGRDAHVDRYRNSPVMHESVPDHYKPLVFEAGVRQPFPAPSKAPKAPRTRNCAKTPAAAGTAEAGKEAVVGATAEAAQEDVPTADPQTER